MKTDFALFYSLTGKISGISRDYEVETGSRRNLNECIVEEETILPKMLFHLPDHYFYWCLK